MRPSVPVVVLASTDPTVRDTAIGTALLDHPGLVVVLHELRDDGGGGPTDETHDGDASTARASGTRAVDPDGVTLVRRVMDWSGTRSHHRVPLEHACAGCALREDALPAIAELIDDGVAAVLLALPLGAEILPATRQLAAEMEPGGRLFGARLGLAVTATSAPDLAEQLGDGDDDLVSQLVAADIVLLAGNEPTGRDLADALRSPFSTLVPDLCEPWVLEAIAGHHDVEDLTERCDPVTSGPGHGFTCVDSADGVQIAASGVWQIELTSERAFHPERLLALMARLAPDVTTSRGVFWLANRPDTACGWEATGGTVLVGVAGPWEEAEPVTRLDVVGHGDAARAPWRHIRRAFEQALVTEEELADPSSWLGRTDPLAPYLGDPADLYRT